MSDREKLMKQWRNLPVNERVTWETFKRQQRPDIVRRSRPDVFTLNGNTHEINNDPAHQREQLEGYCGNNPK